MSGPCHYCGTTVETRPYGPGGDPICFPCMKASPEREDAAKGAFGALLGAATAPTGVAIATTEGPQPVGPDDLAALIREQESWQ